MTFGLSSVLTVFLSIFSVLVECTENGSVLCHEDGSVDDHSSSFHYDATNQKTLQQVGTWAAKGTTSTESRLLADVKQDFLNRLPPAPQLDEMLRNLSGEIFRVIHRGVAISVVLTDIKIPTTIATCRPLLSDVIQLAEGLNCLDPSKQRGCKFTRHITATQSYTNTVGFAITTTIEVGGSGNVFSASVSTSFEKNWEHQWTVVGTEGNQWEFELNRGERCIPSMAHVDLECSVTADTYYYDNWWRFNKMTLEVSDNRKGGPYANGQWCRTARVQEAPLVVERNWTPVTPDDPDRGMLWKLPASEMNRFRVGNQPLIRDDQIIIRRMKGRGGTFTEIFVCDRAPRERVVTNYKMPLSSPRGALLGYIACVFPPR